MPPRQPSHRASPRTSISLITPLLLLLQLHVAPTTASCSSELAVSGWPPCANKCFSICDKYCPSSFVDPTCTCTTPDYTREAYQCLRQSCSNADAQYIYGTSAQGCAALGYDISDHLTPAESSALEALPSSTSQTTAAPGGGDGNGDGEGNKGDEKKGVPVATVVGISLGIGLGLLAGGAAIWFYMRRRKRQRAAASAVTAVQTPVVEQTVHVEPKQNMQQPPYNPGMYPGPPPGVHDTPMNNANAIPPPGYRMEVEGNTPGNAPGWRPPHELAGG